MEEGLRVAFRWFFFFPSGEYLHVQPCCWGVKITKHFKDEIQFLAKHLGCMHSQLNPFIFVIALAFSQQPLGLFPMGSITFALCFSFFPCTGISLASRPTFASNEAVSLPFAVQAHFCL